MSEPIRVLHIVTTMNRGGLETMLMNYYRNIDKSNLSYIEPHRIIIKGITFLAFNYSKTLYVGNLSNKLELKDLETFIKELN